MNTPIFISDFYCYDCENKWTIFKDYPRSRSECQMCGYKIKSHKIKIIRNKKTNIRCFGRFDCQNKKCGNSWYSAYTWILYQQKCFWCRYKTYPAKLSQLKNDDGGQGSDDDKENKHHIASFCAKCQEVGDCRKFKNSSYNGDYFEDYYNYNY